MDLLRNIQCAVPRLFWAGHGHAASGSTSIEYALIASGVALAILTAVGFLGAELVETFSRINSTVVDAR